MENKIQQSIDDVKKFKENLNSSIKEVDEVRNNEISEDDEKQEPYFVLLEGISDSIINILQQETVSKLFQDISKNIGEDTTKSLIDLLTITMTYSSYNAISFYDNLLKEELTKQFDNYGEHLNAAIGSIKAHDSVLSVFGKRLTDLENIDKINNIEKSL